MRIRKTPTNTNPPAPIWWIFHYHMKDEKPYKIQQYQTENIQDAIFAGRAYKFNPDCKTDYFIVKNGKEGRSIYNSVIGWVV